jgi:hypothetical protein
MDERSLSALSSSTNKTARLVCKDGDVVIGVVLAVSTFNNDVIVKVEWSNNSERYLHKESTYVFPIEEHKSVELV